MGFRVIDIVCVIVVCYAVYLINGVIEMEIVVLMDIRCLLNFTNSI